MQADGVPNGLAETLGAADRGDLAAFHRAIDWRRSQAPIIVASLRGFDAEIGWAAMRMVISEVERTVDDPAQSDLGPLAQAYAARRGVRPATGDERAATLARLRIRDLVPTTPADLRDYFNALRNDLHEVWIVEAPEHDMPAAIDPGTGRLVLPLDTAAYGMDEEQISSLYDVGIDDDPFASVRLSPDALDPLPVPSAPVTAAGASLAAYGVPADSMTSVADVDGRPPIARTNREADLVLARDACPACRRNDTAWTHELVDHDGELLTLFRGTCRWCGSPRHALFRLPERETLGGGPEARYGGPEPSRIFDAGEWLAYSDVCGLDVRDAISGGADARQIAADVVDCAAAVYEVLKFIPVDADELPESALFTFFGRAYYDRAPLRFTRRRLELLLDLYREEFGPYTDGAAL